MSKSPKNVAAAAVTAGLLALVSGPSIAGDATYKSISKASKAGPQVTEHAPGTFVVKCVGAAKGGENDCGALDGSHPCAGQSAANVDNSMNEWVYLTLGACADHPNGHFLVKNKDGAMVMSKAEFQFKLV